MKIRQLASILSIAFFLTSCGQISSSGPPVPSKKTQGVLVGAAAGAAVGASGAMPVAAGTGIGAIVGGAFATYISRNDSLIDQLRWSGVDIIFVGEDVKFILPADRFFNTKGTGINPAYYPVLNGIATMIGHYEKTTVKIAGFTDCEEDSNMNLGRSTAQAQSIAEYLRHQHIDARLLYSIGYGDKYAIAENNTQYGRGYNRRIEITLRRIPDGPIV